MDIYPTNRKLAASLRKEVTFHFRLYSNLNTVNFSINPKPYVMKTLKTLFISAAIFFLTSAVAHARVALCNSETGKCYVIGGSITCDKFILDDKWACMNFIMNPGSGPGTGAPAVEAAHSLNENRNDKNDHIVAELEYRRVNERTMIILKGKMVVMSALVT